MFSPHSRVSWAMGLLRTSVDFNADKKHEASEDVGLPHKSGLSKLVGVPFVSL